MNSSGDHAPDERGRCATAEAIALMRPLGVVVPHEAVEGSLQRGARREVTPPEGHAPELLEAEVVTGDIKRPLELRAAIGEHAGAPASPRAESAARRPRAGRWRRRPRRGPAA